MIEPGFYWVRIVGHGDEWTVAELDAGKWWVIGSGDSWEGTACAQGVHGEGCPTAVFSDE